MSKYMYCLSPDYARAIAKESSKYSFIVKAFTDEKDAYSNLLYTNVADIVGFVISYYDLPTDLTDLVSYINFLNRVAKGKPVVLSLDLMDGFQDLRDNIQVDNIHFFVVHVKEAFTDYVIKRNIFGTVLKDVYTPYLENKPSEVVEFKKCFLEYEPLLTSDLQLVFEELPRVDSHQRALDLDTVLPQLEELPTAYALRQFRIDKRWGIDSYEKTKRKIGLGNKSQIYMSCLEIINKGMV